MPGDADNAPSPTSTQTAKERAARRRRLDQIFGETLPEQSSDDTPAGDEESARDSDAWLRSQVPPHHGN